VSSVVVKEGAPDLLGWRRQRAGKKNQDHLGGLSPMPKKGGLTRSPIGRSSGAEEMSDNGGTRVAPKPPDRTYGGRA